MTRSDTTEGLFDALLDAWGDYQHAEHLASIAYDMRPIQSRVDELEGLHEARGNLKEAFDAYLDARETTTRTTLARYVTENGYCRVCAGTGDTPKGDTCKFCDGYGRPA